MATIPYICTPSRCPRVLRHLIIDLIIGCRSTSVSASILSFYNVHAKWNSHNKNTTKNCFNLGTWVVAGAATFCMETHIVSAHWLVQRLSILLVQDTCIFLNCLCLSTCSSIFHTLCHFFSKLVSCYKHNQLWHWILKNLQLQKWQLGHKKRLYNSHKYGIGKEAAAARKFERQLVDNDSMDAVQLSNLQMDGMRQAIIHTIITGKNVTCKSVKQIQMCRSFLATGSTWTIVLWALHGIQCPPSTKVIVLFLLSV